MLGYHQHNGRDTRALTARPRCSNAVAGRENLMLFVIIGILLIVLNVANIGPFGAWNWDFFGDLWKFTVPFIFAVVWWVYSDLSGLNKRREMERMEQKKRDRRQENLVSLGMDTRARRKARKQQP
jgi:small Trp-rich protein